MKVIYIKWFDAYYNEDPCLLKDIRSESPCIIETVGILVDISDQYICIATQSVDNGEYKFRHYIPICNIIKKKFLKV